MINQLLFMCGVQRSATGYPDSANSGVLLCYNIISDIRIKRFPFFPSSGQIQTSVRQPVLR